MFEKVLVANRGEIAVRVMRACEELGVETVAIYSEADRDGGHVRYADEAYRVGPARASESYLDQAAILEVAAESGAEAVHPGYGFLAENADFAAAVADADLTWVGPSAETMRALGTKTSARRLMADADVPIVPGTVDPIETADEVAAFGDEHGFPIAIKAAGGGGGRGLRVVRSADGIADALEAAKREGEAYFDDPTVYLERYLAAPKHIEVQVLADEHENVRHLGERDCSLQRRHQKLIEEAPSPALDDDLRASIGEAARQGVAEAAYTNAGTVEFLVEDDAYYFLEVNTRIQVEHTVTEVLTGIDIVKWQLRIAAGEPIDFAQADVDWRGHAIEYRINAENPAEGFSPTPGAVTTYDPPGGIGVRLDDALRQGDTVVGDYDSMVAKLIVAGADRAEALARSERALAEFVVDGVHTTIPFHRLMLADETFRAGEHTTRYLDETFEFEPVADAVERWGPTSLAGPPAARELHEFTVEVNGKRFEVALEDHSAPPPEAADRGGSRADDEQATADVADQATGQEVRAEMQGTILDVRVAEGDEVEPGDVVCVLEAMKMENDVVTERGGTVTAVAVAVGDSVTMGDTLVVIE